MRISGDIARRSRGAEALNRAALGWLVVALILILPLAPGNAAAQTRTISLFNIHTKETLTIAFKRDGRFIRSALKKINWHLRDWRSNTETTMDPDLIDLLWEIHKEVGSRKPVHVISAYRSPKTNAMLRKTRGGQARRSQHLLGKAMDVRFPDVPVRTLRYSALIREQGGVGYYPTSATPFVHIDTGRVRHWPRMGRQELALLFPSGRTRHRPASGGPITRTDARIAREKNPNLARRVIAFHDARRNGTFAMTRPTQVAAATPRLVSQPRPAPRPPEPIRASLGVGAWSYSFKPAPKPALAVPNTPARPAITPPEPRLARPQLAALPDANRRLRPPPSLSAPSAMSNDDRSRLAKLAAMFASLAPKPSTASGPSTAREWIAAPAFDDEHPEELFYRPFPVLPYITETASADDTALQTLVHPSIEETLDYLVADGSPDRALQLRPGPSTANLLWALAFSGASNDSTRGALAARAPDPQQPVLGRNFVRLAGSR